MSAALPAGKPAPAPPSSLLPTLRGPADLKVMPAEWLPVLAQEIRDELIQVTARNGGHLGPNLGVVELTIALHRVFDTPRDRFVFDVSHQGYVHKLLTGRAGDGFRQIRKTGGVSGFLNRTESPHDAFGAGHAGTALSAALGFATARDLLGTSEHVVALCGDAAFTCGITMEALNNIVHATKRLILVLNDNEWSIARNVGAMAKYLNELSTSPTYNRIYHDIEEFFRSTPRGERLHQIWMKWKRETKDFFVESSLFEKYGLRYLGPIDGHDIPLLVKNLEFAKQADCPVVVHVLTKKGKGYEVAREFPERFHGTSPFDIATGNGHSAPGAKPAYQDVFGQALVREAQLDNRVVGITGAMPSGTGLSALAKALPRQFFDVGIAEEHAVLFAAGLAAQGVKPVVAIYSTFLQRSYDQIVHDVCLQKLPVVFCLDRAGLSPNDGATHHGLFDLSYLRNVPHAAIAQPKDEDELCDLLHTALQGPLPTFIRYPRGSGPGATPKAQPAVLPIGKGEVLREGAEVALWALGPWVPDALALADRLERELGVRATVVNARWVKPLDRELLLAHARTARLLVTLEDNVALGGFGSAVLEALNDAALATPVERIAWPDEFIEHGSNVDVLRAAHGLDAESVYRRIAARLR
ncbi:MAG: 1-deoxy-D-xylulose-5-phosphate synthase [Opitutaceae bacterium]